MLILDSKLDNLFIKNLSISDIVVIVHFYGNNNISYPLNEQYLLGLNHSQTYAVVVVLDTWHIYI